jgi:hypothetical protein
MLLLAGYLAEVLLAPTIPDKQPLRAQDTNNIFYNATDAGATA